VWRVAGKSPTLTGVSLLPVNGLFAGTADGPDFRARVRREISRGAGHAIGARAVFPMWKDDVPGLFGCDVGVERPDRRDCDGTTEQGREDVGGDGRGGRCRRRR